MNDFNDTKLYKNFITDDFMNDSELAKMGISAGGSENPSGELNAPEAPNPESAMSSGCGAGRIFDFLKVLCIFLAGALGYGLIEFLFRGYTHWSMLLTGGSCLLTLYYLNRGFKNTPITVKALIGAGVITLYELGVGLIINVWLGWAVWDYSALPYNFLGQICLLFSVFWFIICFGLSALSWLGNFIFKTASRKASFRL